MIAAIGAVANNRVLGLNNWLPWDIPEELAYFEKTVKGAALVVGRSTYESMDVVPEDMFVLTRHSDKVLRAGCHAASSVEEAICRAQATGKSVFVIGGASVYEAAWRYCEYLYLTQIDLTCAGDTYFPESISWAECELKSAHTEHLKDKVSGQVVACRFMVYRQSEHQTLQNAVCP